MGLILRFSECSYKNKHLVGGKCASLGELYNLSTNFNFNISDGFAITTEMYDEFLNHYNLHPLIKNKLDLFNLNDKTSITELHIISDHLMNLIMSAELLDNHKKIIKKYYNDLCSEYNNNIQVAVRSSAIAEDMPNASFAGQQDTYLNVVSYNDLLFFVKKCFASLFNSRAISYRKTNNIKYYDVKISIGVQRMIRSDKGCAGVGFTLDPNNGYNKAIVINASWGNGEMVVSGKVTPDEYIVDKRALINNASDPILVKKIGNKNEKMIYKSNLESELIEVETTDFEKLTLCLSNSKIIELSRTMYKLEKHYAIIHNTENMSIDVEWALDGIDNKLYILQARPETIHSNMNKSNIKIMKTYKLNDMNNLNLLTQGVAVGTKISNGTVKVLESMDEYEQFNHGDILVTDITTPDWEPLMKISGGIITNKGGKTCHAAIVARELGINACVGCEGVTTLLNGIKEVTIDCSDGDVGKIYENIIDFSENVLEIDTNKKLPVKIMMNIGSPESCFEHSMLPNQGVGLVRMEFIINNYIKIHPLALYNYKNMFSDDPLKMKINDIMLETGMYFKDGSSYFIHQLSHGLAKIASAFYPNKVNVRLSDFKSNEYKNLLGGDRYEPDEENPMIGWRGASRYYDKDYIDAFRLECASILYARNDMLMNNIVVLIPFCRTPDECKKVVDIMSEEGLSRGYNNLQIHLTCELPSNIMEADEFSEYIDGVSIGGNDLLQLTIGVDRDSEKITHLSNNKNLSYRRMIKMAIQNYKKHNIKVGFCGQQPSDSNEFCDFLIENNIDSLSVTPDSILKINHYLSK
ncbi:phosphoenolpyruvate synthase [bacterium]|nr:phosphoenolpyruvate synthase [bacterium]|tara:strand:- start:1374 stop:3794 length:2421 start_codon:yes stop_codon:yes gene_type:complete